MLNWLLLIPTTIEQNHFSEFFLEAFQRCGDAIEICGFGPVVSAARTAALVERLKPRQVILCGIAGAIGSQLPVGSACRFDAVACYGIGVGCGQQHRTASNMDWKQWPGDDSPGPLSEPIADVIELSRSTQATGERKLLLTACAASANESEVAMKLNAYPTAIAEDMEGFAVAAACQLVGVPLSIVRGISNRAGDRTHQNWKIKEAMTAAAMIAQEIIES